MPRERHLSAYASAHYWRLVTEVLRRHEAILLPMAKTKAATLRGEIYAWRRAAEKAPLAAGQLGIDLNEIRRVAFRITDEGLEAIPETLLAGPAAIEAALGPVPPLTTAASPAEVALQRLRQALGDAAAPVAPVGPYNLADKT